MNTKNTNLKHRRRQRFPAFHLVLQFMSHTLLFDDIVLFFRVIFDVINANALQISNIDADSVFQHFILSSKLCPHPHLWLYSTLLRGKLWRHKRNCFTNLMNPMKQVFLAAHRFHSSVLQLYLLQMCCFFFCVLIDVIGFSNLNTLMPEWKLFFLVLHILVCFF